MFELDDETYENACIVLAQQAENIVKCPGTEKVIFIVSFSLLFLHILLGECLSALGIVVPIPIVRNFALMGIPFFALGGKVCLVL